MLSLRTCLVGVLTLSAVAPASAQVQWQIKQFSSACRLVDSVILPANDAGALGVIGLASELPGGGYLLPDPRTPRVVIVSSRGAYRVVGRVGSAPGEFRRTVNRVALSPSKKLAVPDAGLMRLTIFDSTLRSPTAFPTAGTPGGFAEWIGDSLIALAGFIDHRPGGRNHVVGIYSPKGELRSSFMPIGGLATRLTPKLYRAFVLAIGDELVVAGDGIEPRVEVRDLRTARSRTLDLSLPASLWRLINPEPTPRSMAEMRAVAERGTTVEGAGVLRRGIVALGLHTGAHDHTGEDLALVLDVAASKGVAYRGMPGRLLTAGSAGLSVLLPPTDAADVIGKFDCR